MNSDSTTKLLRSQIFYLIDNGIYTSAEFACERLLAQNSQDENSIHLYGLVLYKRKKYSTAINVTLNHRHVGCAYVCAQASMELGEYDRGDLVLSGVIDLWENNTKLSTEFERNIIPDAAACFTLLGKLQSLLNNKQKAAWYYSEALKLNPYIFEAFEELCKMGAAVRTRSIYKISNDLDTGSNLFPIASTEVDSFSNQMFQLLQQDQLLPQPLPSNQLATPNIKSSKNFFSRPLSTPDNNSSRSKQQTPLPPDAPTRRPTRQQNNFDGFARPSDTINRRSVRSTASKVSSRLTSHPLNNLTNNVGNNLSINLTNPIAGTQHTLKRGRQPSVSNNTSFQSLNLKDTSGENYLMNLYLLFARAFKASCAYDCFKAIRLLDSLPENQKQTPWVLGKLGRLHFEIVNYEESLKYFTKLREIDRTRIEDMEYFSTLLWHLRDESQLNFLARELLSIDQHAPQTWVAMGNSCSLRKDPDLAISCFQRATELDSKYAYAYTLQGHEHVSNDAFENALQSFRGALLIDERHYNALYGMGMVYLKIGDFHKAEYHFRKALETNPVNCILICCLGMVLEKMNKKEQALKQYVFANKLQPLSALALFKKAQLLFSMEDFDNAIVDFEKLVNIAPDEASVHFLLGQLYKISGKRFEAIREFTIALNLDPKGAHLVKEAMESLGEFTIGTEENKEN